MVMWKVSIRTVADPKLKHHLIVMPDLGKVMLGTSFYPHFQFSFDLEGVCLGNIIHCRSNKSFNT